MEQKGKQNRKKHAQNQDSKSWNSLSDQIEKLNMGRWTVEQDIKYLEFLQENRALFEKTNNKRSNRVFKKLAQIIPMRTPEQCRSHHLKLCRTCHDSIDLVIDYVKKKIKEIMGELNVPHMEKQLPQTMGKKQKYTVEMVKCRGRNGGNRLEEEIVLQVRISFDDIATW